MAGECQRIVQKTHLEQQRRVLDKFDIDPCNPLQKSFAAGGHQAKGNPQAERQNQRKDRRFEGVAKPQKKSAAVGPDLAPCLG